MQSDKRYNRYMHTYVCPHAKWWLIEFTNALIGVLSVMWVVKEEAICNLCKRQT